LDEDISIVEVNWSSHSFDDLDSFVKGNSVTIRDSSWMNSLVKKLLGSLKKGTGNNDNRCGSISSLNILGL
jgi:hypothetical protein